MKIRLLKEILPERAKYQVRPRGIEIALEKVKEGPYWERLLEEKTKQHWLKIDFEKWKDEDDSEEEEEPVRFEDRMKEMDSLVKISNKAFGTNVEKDAVDNKEGLDDVMKGLSPFSSMMMFGEYEGEEKMRRLCRVQQKISKKPSDYSSEIKDEKFKLEVMKKFPEFHTEYSRKYGGEQKHFEKLASVQNTFKMCSMMFSSYHMIEKDLYHKNEDETEFVLKKRWGSNLLNDRRFEQFFLKEPLHSIFEQKTEMIRYNPFQFQSMKNYTIPEWVYEFGQTHISIGCVDFQQLLLGKLDQSNGGR